MPLLGTPLVPRKASRMLWDEGWVQAENHALMLATLWAEAELYPWAFHYNAPLDDGNGSTDWGWCQLSDGNEGGLPPIVVNGKPVPQAGGKKSLAEVEAFVKMALDPIAALHHARAMYVDRGTHPWYAGPDYPHPDGKAWKKWYPSATYALRAMLHERKGFPLP